ncbi:MAG: ABC transporter ATP-binding protein/permease [Treponema sp.]|jgi:ATP-binding cassette subfamily B protein|nr:ABC transporter ATP-binding protein/permease [Treponema sp.]
MRKENKRKTGMSRLFELALRRKFLVVSSCFLSVVSNALSFTPFIAAYFIIREIVAHFADPALLDGTALIRFGVMAFGGAAGAVLIYFIALMCSHLAAFTTIYRLKLEFTDHIASLPMGFHTRNSTGKLRKIVDVNIEKLETFIAHQLPDIAGSTAMPVITLVILLVFDWRMGLASLAPILAGYLLQAVAYGGKKARIFIEKYQTSLEEMNNAAVEYVRGISVVKAFNQTIFSFRRFHEVIMNYGKFVRDYTFSFETPWILFMTIINHVYLFLVPVILLISGNVNDYPAFALASVFYLLFSVSVPTPFTKLMYVSQLGKQVADGIERMDRILDVPPLAETPSPKTVSSHTVVFDNVSFSYNETGENKREIPALSQLSFSAEQGAVTALVGPSGSGKSTIAHLIPRFYDAGEGAVKIGGVDIREMSSEYLMDIVSFVFQDVFLFKQSIMDNILVGNRNASREDAVAAARAAQCHDFIEKLPHGYDTVIGTRNIHLSGGERQRIVIARAILKNAPVIVLDEATAFADPENEQKIQKAFEKLIKDKTVIIIAHRLSTVRGADKILVIDGGRLVEQGRHDELVNAGGRYSRMWEQYTGATRWKLTQKETALSALRQKKQGETHV